MCMLTFYPPHVMPNTEALRNGAYRNDDGHGFAIVTGGKIIVRHGMYPETMIAGFERAREEHPDGPALFHSRFGTHGTRGRHNCHPFRVGGDRRTVLAHNGILPELVQPTKGDRRCDTRVAAEELFPHDPFGHLDTRDARTKLETWLGRTNKLVFLTVNPRYRDHAYLINSHLGIWHSDGAWYSNHDYTTIQPNQGIAWDWDACPGLACWTCDTPADPADITGICACCGSCLECADPADLCQCWQPRRPRRRTRFDEVDSDDFSDRRLFL